MMILVAVSLVLAALLCGMLLGTRFNALVLVPVSAVVLAGGAYMAVHGPLWFLGAAMIAIVALQAGYVAGLVLMHKMRRSGLFKKKSVSRIP